MLELARGLSSSSAQERGRVWGPPEMTGRSRVNRPPEKVYLSSRRYELTIYDLRLSGTEERLHRERAAWQQHAETEVIDKDHVILIVHTGGARGLTK
jgi:hypothetical protein